MKLKQKFLLLAGIIILILAAVSFAGYWSAKNNLEADVKTEIAETLTSEIQEIDGWLLDKTRPARDAADLITAVSADGEMSGYALHPTLLRLAASDKEILNLFNGNEDGFLMDRDGVDYAATVDPRTRPWYTRAKAENSIVYTNAYEDVAGHGTVLSAGVPYYDRAGKLQGVICLDLTIATLQSLVKTVNYTGVGTGYIIDTNGAILGAKDDALLLKQFADIPDVGGQYRTMVEAKKGYAIIVKAMRRSFLPTIPCHRLAGPLALPCLIRSLKGGWQSFAIHT